MDKYIKIMNLILLMEYQCMYGSITFNYRQINGSIHYVSINMLISIKYSFV